MGKPVGVLLRTGAELEAVIARNPFPEAAPNRLIIMFLDRAPPKDALADLVIPGSERVKLDVRELFIHYPRRPGPIES